MPFANQLNRVTDSESLREEAYTSHLLFSSYLRPGPVFEAYLVQLGIETNEASVFMRTTVYQETPTQTPGND